MLGLGLGLIVMDGPLSVQEIDFSHDVRVGHYNSCHKDVKKVLRWSWCDTSWLR